MITEIAALDLGTTKFCLALLRKKPREAEYSIETLSVPASGMARGMLSDFSKAKQALNKLFDLCEQTFGFRVERVAVGIAGCHLSGRTVSHEQQIPNSLVDYAFVRHLVEVAERENYTDSREILHSVPVKFRVDGRQDIDDPVGFSGNRLHADLFFIDADRHYLRDVVRLCNECGAEVSRLVAEPFASASVTLTEEEKDAGVTLADIGGGTTDGVVFRDGKPVGLFTMDVAGVLMTKDLAMALNISAEDAERAKLRFGILPGAILESLQLNDLNGVTREIGWRETYPYLVPRIHELGEMLILSAGIHPGAARSGLRLTGGGAQVQGICEYLAKQLKIKVSPVSPNLEICRNVLGAQNLQMAAPRRSLSAKYATSVGIVNLELIRWSELARAKKMPASNRFLSKLVNWVREIS